MFAGSGLNFLHFWRRERESGLGSLPGSLGSLTARLGKALRISGFIERTTEPLKMSAGRLRRRRSYGNVYVAGYTDSANFPTAKALQGTYGGGTDDAFITKFPSLAASAPSPQ